MTARHTGLDFLRAVSMLYIVGAYHLLEYTAAARSFYNTTSLQGAILAMAIFVAMSGYLLSSRTNTRKPDWLKKFAVARLVRIYVPFVVALALFVLTHVSSLKVALNAALLTAMFVPPPPSTLWFVDMLVLFYAAAAMVLYWGTDTGRFIWLSMALLAITYLGCGFSQLADERCLIYLPAFLWGMALGRWPQLMDRLPAWLAAPLLLGAIFLTPASSISHPLPYAILALLGSHLAMQLSRTDLAVYRQSWVLAISEASFFMYLLHRPILKLLNDHFQPESEGMQVLFLYGLCLPLIYVAARITQKAYDRIVAPWLMRLMT